MSLDNLPWKTPHVYLLPPRAAWQPESFKNRTYRAIEQRSILPRTVLKGVFLGQVPFPRFQSNRNYAGIFNRVLAVPDLDLGGLCSLESSLAFKNHTPVDRWTGTGIGQLRSQVYTQNKHNGTTHTPLNKHRC